MEELLNKLDNRQIKFICSFANRFIEQIPYIDETTVSFLNKDYLIRKMKSKILQLIMNDEVIEIKNSILKLT